MACCLQWVCYCSFASNNHFVFLHSATTTAYFYYALTWQQPLRIFTTYSATPSNNHCAFLLRTQQHPPLRIFTTQSATPGNKHCVFLLRNQQHPATTTAYFNYVLSNIWPLTTTMCWDSYVLLWQKKTMLWLLLLKWNYVVSITLMCACCCC